MTASLEDELDRLYGVEPGTFTAERNALAKSLRAEGRRDDAERVAGLKKPSVSASIVNRLARQRRKDVDMLLDAGHRIRETQRGVLEGKERAELDEGRRRQEQALDALRDAARELGASGATLERVSRTLRTAGVTDEGRELLARGRFTGDLALQGFDAVAELGAVAKPTTRKPPQPTRAKRDLAKERAALSAARERLREARSELQKLERDAGRARREVENAERAVEAAEARLRDARS